MIDPKEERANFISLREALFMIVQIKSRTPKEAAEMLLRNLNDSDGLQMIGYAAEWGTHPSAGAIRREACDALADIKTCDFFYEQSPFHADSRVPPCLSYHGFDRSDFIIRLCVNPDWAKDLPPSVAKWGIEFHIREYFELGEVACVIEGYDPTNWEWDRQIGWPDDVWETMISLLDSDELEKDGYEFDDGEEFFMAHRDDIAAWCQKRGLYWPLGELPQMQPIPTTSAAANLAQPSDMTSIAGPTFASLMQAIDEFPTTYPDYRENPPKLDNDVRPWLVEQFGCNAREKHVFGQIIAEHFKLQ